MGVKEFKSLGREQVVTLTDYLDQMSEAERPLYGFVGVKTSLWSQMGGGAKPFVVVFMPDRVVFSKRSVTGKKETWSEAHALGDLADVSVREGPLYDSAQLTFTDGYKVRVGNIDHSGGERLISPVVEYMRAGPAAFDRSRLSDYQWTGCSYAYALMGIVPYDLVGLHVV